MWDKEDQGFFTVVTAWTSTWKCHLSTFCREMYVSTAKQSWGMEKPCRAASDGVCCVSFGNWVTVVPAQVETQSHMTAREFRQKVMELLHLSSGLSVVLCPQVSGPKCSWWSQYLSRWSSPKPYSTPVQSVALCQQWNWQIGSTIPWERECL
jgi:hypothetical protein